jgi:hypothetical protein
MLLAQHIIQKCLADMGTGITDVIGGPHDFLSPRSNRFDEFQKLCYSIVLKAYNISFLLQYCAKSIQCFPVIKRK